MKMLIKMFQVLFAVFLLAFGLITPSYALPPDFSALTGAVDFTSLITALGVVFAAIIGVALFYKGGNLIARKLGWT